MAFPTVATVNSSPNTTATFSHFCTVNSPSAGDFLVLFLRFAADPGALTPFPGSTLLVSDSSDASDDTTIIYWKVADGTEGIGQNFTSTNSVKSTSTSYKITGARGEAPAISTVAIGTGANPDPGSVTPPNGTQDYLFIELSGMDGETQTYTASTNYTNVQNSDSGTGGAAATNCRTGTAQRQLNTGSAENPGAMTAAAPSNGWTAWTICISPPAASGVVTREEFPALQAVNRAAVW